MELGLHLPMPGAGVTPADVVRCAVEAEAMGFASVWTFDHLFTPTVLRSKYPYTADGSYGLHADEELLEPVGLLGFVAGATTTIHVGTAVMIPVYRHPIPLAKSLATIDLLAGGRLILGMAVGWMEEEFDAVGVGYSRRGARFEEHITAMRAIWSQGTCSFEGEFYCWEDASFLPRPPRGTIPILFGGHADAVMRRVARIGDGWAISSMLAGGGSRMDRLQRVSLDYYRAGMDRLRRACDAEGRDFATLRNLATRPAIVTDGDGPANRPLLVGSPAQIADDLAVLEEIGISILNLAVWAENLDAALSACERLAAHVLPELSPPVATSMVSSAAGG